MLFHVTHIIDFLRSFASSISSYATCFVARLSSTPKHFWVLGSIASRISLVKVLKVNCAGSLLCCFVYLNSFAVDLKAFQRPAFQKLNPEMQSFVQGLVKDTNAEKIQNGTEDKTPQKTPKWFADVEKRAQPEHSIKLHGSDQSEFYIFASLGLKQKHLKALIEDAKRFKGVVVIRGLKNNSFRETIAYLQSILRKDHEGIQIDPTLFRKYSITSVPTFVLARGDSSHDILKGNVTARFALARMKSQGDLAFEANQRLGYEK